jgi:hypothetical protein
MWRSTTLLRQESAEDNSVTDDSVAANEGLTSWRYIWPLQLVLRARAVVHAVLLWRRYVALRRAVESCGRWNTRRLCAQAELVDTEHRDEVQRRVKWCYRRYRRAEVIAFLVWQRTKLAAISTGLLTSTLFTIQYLKLPADLDSRLTAPQIWILLWAVLFGGSFFWLTRLAVRARLWIALMYAVMGCVVAYLVVPQIFGPVVGRFVVPLGGVSSAEVAARMIALVPLTYMALLVLIQCVIWIGGRVRLVRVERQYCLAISVTMVLHSLDCLRWAQERQNKSVAFSVMPHLSRLALCVGICVGQMGKSHHVSRTQGQILRERGLQAKQVIESYKLWLALPRRDTLPVLGERLTLLARALIWQNYDELPQPEDGQTISRVTRAGVLYVLRQLVVAAMPAVALLVSQAFDWQLPETLRPTASIVVSLWALLTFMSLIDPAIRDKMSLTNDVVSMFKPSKQPKN